MLICLFTLRFRLTINQPVTLPLPNLPQKQLIYKYTDLSIQIYTYDLYMIFNCVRTLQSAEKISFINYFYLLYNSILQKILCYASTIFAETINYETIMYTLTQSAYFIIVHPLAANASAGLKLAVNFSKDVFKQETNVNIKLHFMTKQAVLL